MPMIDVFIPEDALSADSEASLMRELTDILIAHEGLDPSNERVRDVSWIFVHRPAVVYRAGKPAPAPIYRIVPTVPEGQYTGEARASLVKEVTAAVARAEGTSSDEIAPRVWVFPTEIRDGSWGARGGIRHLPEIMESFGGEALKAIGKQRLQNKRRSDAVEILEAAVQSLRLG
ncbi:tautomerase family protein [Rhizobium sp. BR 314]|uniref:tautomerase family protein n=1 Tax=Rhizobium sp. BR 314 TaxID=3040013 RepID=UPI0039BFB821